MAELNTALSIIPEQRNENMKFFIPQVGIEYTTIAFTIVTLCHDNFILYDIIKQYSYIKYNKIKYISLKNST